jgi:hypothetical protein
MQFRPVSDVGRVLYWEAFSMEPHDEVETNVRAILLGDERRSIVGRVANMIASFWQTADARWQLNQDCGAFALACATGQSYDGKTFYC